MGLININPASWYTTIKDDKVKQQLETVGVSVAYSQYISFMYNLGDALSQRRFIGWLGDVLMNTATACYVQLATQRVEGKICFGVPKKLVNDKVRIDSVYAEQITQGDKQ